MILKASLIFLLFNSSMSYAQLTPWAMFQQKGPTDPCLGSPSPSDVCDGGAIFLGTLSPGATSGSGTDRYMTTPGGCGEIPAGQIVGSGATAYPSADFTPTCSGSDSVVKTYDDGTVKAYDHPTLPNYTGTTGLGSGASNIDLNYGSTNTATLAANTDPAKGGYHAAALYCDKLVLNGYSDWHLPNRYELNLFFTNKASIPGLNVAGAFYRSSTEGGANAVWIQRFNDGNQQNTAKNQTRIVRCVRRF